MRRTLKRVFRRRESFYRMVTRNQANPSRTWARSICVHLCSSVVFLCSLSTPVRGQDYRIPEDVLPPERASKETLDQSVSRASLRFEGLDLFPHAAVTAMYDDNVLIAHTNAISDVQWTFSPGLTVTAGDIATYFPGSVSLDQLRELAYYSLVEGSSMPQRFLGVDYTPGFNFFTENPRLNYTDQSQGLSAGYAFSRLALGLDEDFTRTDSKDNEVGNLVTVSRFDTKLRSRYEMTDRSSLEVNGRYDWLGYEDKAYHGYQEVRNEDWFNRLVGARLELAIGAAFGLVYPEASPDQTYEQGLVRGLYRLTGKLDVRASAGIELRQYDSGQSATVDPVLSLSAAYRPRDSTALTLEAHRQQEPSYEGSYNYQTTGFNAGVRQQLSGELSASLTGGYNYGEYLLRTSGPSNNRRDNYLWVRATLDYEFSRHLKASLIYTLRLEDSSTDVYSYTDNIVGVQVAWRY